MNLDIGHGMPCHYDLTICGDSGLIEDEIRLTLITVV